MKFYPRLGIFKSSNGRNRFDGERAYSYDWYCYALKLPDGRFAMPSDSYSNTTAKHERDWFRLVGYNTPTVKVTAPEGLTNTDAMRAGIARKQEKLREEMARKGARKAKNLQRQAEIDRLEAELETVALIEGVLGERKVA